MSIVLRPSSAAIAVRRRCGRRAASRRAPAPRRRLFTARTRGAARVPPRPGGSCSAQVARVGTRRLSAFPRSRALRSLYKPPPDGRAAFRVRRSALTHTLTHTQRLPCLTRSRIRSRTTARSRSRALINTAKWWSRCSSARGALASTAAWTSSRSWWSARFSRKERTSRSWRKPTSWSWPCAICTSFGASVGCRWTPRWTPIASAPDSRTPPTRCPAAWPPSPAWTWGWARSSWRTSATAWTTSSAPPAATRRPPARPARRCPPCRRRPATWRPRRRPRPRRYTRRFPWIAPPAATARRRCGGRGERRARSGRTRLRGHICSSTARSRSPPKCPPSSISLVSTYMLSRKL